MKIPDPSVEVTVPDSNGEYILAVSYDPNALYLIKVNLESMGYKVETVENTEQALSKIQERKPDLIITDVGMPDTPGFELTDTIRADASLANLTIVMMYGSPEDPPSYNPGISC